MKLGIIGSGMIVKDFLSTANKVDNLELVALSSTLRSAKIAQDIAKEYHIPHTYTDNAKLCHDPEIDTVYVAVPNSLHYEIVKQAILADKNVICEKPYVSTTAQAKYLQKLAQDHDVILLEAITSLHLPNFIKIKEALKEIAPVHISILNYTQYSSRYDKLMAGTTLPVFDQEKEGGCLADLNIYNIHLAVGLFGAPKKVTYFPVMQKGTDTSGIVNLTYAGLQASLIGSKDCHANPPRSVIEGERGTISFSGSTGVLDGYTIDLRNGDTKTYNFNKHAHRMTDEFDDFTKIIDHHDTQEADRLYEHSLLVMDVLEKARTFIK